VLQSLCERLGSQEIWVDGSDRYWNPDDDLPTSMHGAPLAISALGCL
jgi:hypothetical protein